MSGGLQVDQKLQSFPNTKHHKYQNSRFKVLRPAEGVNHRKPVQYKTVTQETRSVEAFSLLTHLQCPSRKGQENARNLKLSWTAMRNTQRMEVHAQFTCARSPRMNNKSTADFPAEHHQTTSLRAGQCCQTHCPGPHESAFREPISQQGVPIFNTDLIISKNWQRIPSR